MLTSHSDMGRGLECVMMYLRLPSVTALQLMRWNLLLILLLLLLVVVVVVVVVAVVVVVVVVIVVVWSSLL
jgi:hypothetical protein